MYTAIILSGGLGTRLHDLVSDVPKPLAPINNRPFLEYLLDYWIERGVTYFILSVGYMHEKIIEHFGDDNQFFSCREIIDLLRENREWAHINSSVIRKGHE